ncbi:hypothetical protein IEQ34_000178 [Dendrobium chrysotoxum]|uniref:Uncharacterized protein n=1 Tax=Dendrobium chrysotoxum TaxID=161865 RepID=A0AAV7HQL8_DENCH|nr:hypothetical protein IEQ34_000178 [Dendrobium chrysotoxum]
MEVNGGIIRPTRPSAMFDHQSPCRSIASLKDVDVGIEFLYFPRPSALPRRGDCCPCTRGGDGGAEVGDVIGGEAGGGAGGKVG